MGKSVSVACTATHAGLTAVTHAIVQQLHSMQMHCYSVMLHIAEALLLLDTECKHDRHSAC